MIEPTVSIVVNCFNGAQTLRRCLDSILAQTVTDWEIVFWDNMSTDNSAAIAKSYGNKLRYFNALRKTNLSEGRRRALEKCVGEYVAFLDCDDCWYPNKLRLQLDKLQGTNYIVCYAGVKEVSPLGVSIRSLIPKYKDGNQFRDHLRQFDINMVTPLIKMEALKRHHITFDDEIVASEEYNIFMRLAVVGEFCSVTEVLGEWTIHENSLTNQSIESWSSDRRRTLDTIKLQNSNVVDLYARDFRIAYAGSDYYEARFLISRNQWKQARSLLRNNAMCTKTFFGLWVLSMIPSLWRLLHNERIKRMLSVYVLRKSKSA